MSEHTPTNLSPAAPEEPGDAVLAARLANHLRAELDPQRGRSAEAFRLYALAQQGAGKKRTNVTPPRPVWRGGPWTFTFVGGALAASLMLLVTTAAPLFRGSAADSELTPVQQQPVRFLPVGPPPVVRTDSTTHTHFYDAGTVLDSTGRPMRRVRRLNVQENRWRNESTGEQVDQLVPSEDEVLYEVKTY
jgi:hypothetical protein